MVKLVDTPDLKSVVRKDVPVRLRLGAPIKSRIAELRSSIPPSNSGSHKTCRSAILPVTHLLLSYHDGRMPKLIPHLDDIAVVHICLRTHIAKLV